MRQFTVTGMSCAACSARVEKAVCALDGVDACSVNLLTNSMSVDGTVSPEEVIAAVERAGYGAAEKGIDRKAKSGDDSFEDKEGPHLKRRLFSSLGFLILLMYFSMGHMLKLPMPAFFDGNYIAIGITQMLLAAAIMVINKKFFVNGFKGLAKRAPNMDTLVALGSGASFIYSVYALFAMTDFALTGDVQAVMSYMHEFYFESAAMILVLITVGKMLEARSKGKTTSALKGLVNLAPKAALVSVDGVEKEIPADEIKVGDIFIVKPGMSIPADGVIIEGQCSINESALTGESIPVDKDVGDLVSAATVNTSGYIKCRATKVGEDTLLSRIIQMVSDAAASKAPIAKAADKVSGVFVPIVIGIAMITLIVWLVLGESVGFALARSISVLVISCPCALGLATPVAIMVGNGVGAKSGILFKTAAALEAAGKTRIVALDKTGTITKGEPEVTDILPADGFSADELLRLAYSLEVKSEHPLAQAVVKEAEKQACEPKESTDFKVLPGNGLSAVIDGAEISGGSFKFISEKIKIPAEMKTAYDTLTAQGKTPLFFAKGDSLIGIIAVFDTIKPSSPEAIRELQNMGIHVVMLTGDNERTAAAVKEITGVDEVYAGVLPDDKERIIRELKARGKCAMVGDGINDAPALASADIGIAIGAGTDIAIDAADIVLMKNTLSDIPAAIRLSRATLKNIYENLFWAFIYNVICIPLAAGVWIPVFGLKLNPMFGAAAMSLSSICVVSNALRLNLTNIRSAAKDRKMKFKKKENEEMEKILKIQGMMCPHCEARVKKCLEEIDGVVEAVPSHETATATVKLSRDVSEEVLKKAVEAQGYTVE